MLSHALAKDPDALACDMAETYHIFDLHSLPVRTIATLAAGLGAESRTMRGLTGVNMSRTEMLLAVIADGIRTLVWFKTKDGQKGRNRPKSLLEELRGASHSQDAPVSFASVEEFEAARKRILSEVT